MLNTYWIALVFAFCLKTKENFLFPPANCGPVCVCSPVKKRDILNKNGKNESIFLAHLKKVIEDNFTW